MGRSKAPKSGSVHPNGQPAPAAPANTTGQVVPKTSPEASGAGNSAPPIEPMEEEKGFWSSAFSAVASLDVHDALDAVGMVPGLGIAADLTNAALYAYEKDYTNAAISLAAASPIGGQAATAAKHATKAAAKAKAKQEAAEAAAKKADAPPPSKPPKKDKDTEEAKEGEGKDGGYVEGGGKQTKKSGEATVHKFDNQEDFNRAANNPKPNSQYEYNDYVWKTDDKGRVTEASGKVRLQKANGRGGTDGISTVKIGKEGQDGDIGFHLVGDQFEGPTNRLNVVPGNGKRVNPSGPPNLNQGQYAKFEKAVKEARLAPENVGKDIEIKISPKYNSGNTTSRPDSFVSSYKIEGQSAVKFRFKNSQGGQ